LSVLTDIHVFNEIDKNMLKNLSFINRNYT